MPTITGLTAARMQEIIDSTIVDADVSSQHLILTKEDGSTIDAGSLQQPATNVVVATPNLVVGDGNSGTAPLGAVYLLTQVKADRPCRIRLYSTPTKRTADVGRPDTVDPPDYPVAGASPNHGCILEVILTAAHLVGAEYIQSLSPNVVGSSAETPRSNNIAYRIDNTDVSAHVINVTFTEQVLEAV